MNMKQFPVIDPIATGKNIIRLRVERGMSVRDLQAYFGFEEPQVRSTNGGHPGISDITTESDYL